MNVTDDPHMTRILPPVLQKGAGGRGTHAGASCSVPEACGRHWSVALATMIFERDTRAMILYPEVT